MDAKAFLRLYRKIQRERIRYRFSLLAVVEERMSKKGKALASAN